MFSLAPLAAAAWAQSGFSKPIAAQTRLLGPMQFSWPTIEGRLELPSRALAVAPAALPASAPATATQPMRVRLIPPVASKPRPKLELTSQAPARIHFVEFGYAGLDKKRIETDGIYIDV